MESIRGPDLFRFIKILIFFMVGGCLGQQHSFDPERSLLLKEIFSPEYDIVSVNDQILKSGPVYKNKALLHALETGKWADVTKISKKMLEQHPFDPSALSLLAVAALHQNEPERSLYFAKMASAKREDQSFFFNMKGLVRLKSASMWTDFQDAMTWFRKALSENNRLWSARLNYAYLLLKMGQKEKALGEFKQASRHCDQCVSSRLGSALTLLRMPEDEEKGVSLMQQLMSEYPGIVEIPYELGVYYFSKGNKKEASRLFKKIKNDPVSSSHARLKKKIVSLEKLL